jgi:hypothetical protein
MDIKNQISEVLKKYNKFTFNDEDNSFEGTIDISQDDSYNIRMEIANYPNHFPIVFELDGRIPNKPERHIYSDSKSLCFTTRAQAQILLKTKITSLLIFIDEILVKYLENNSFYELNNRYFNDEYSHDSSGILESYQDILGVNDMRSIARVLLGRICSKKITIRDLCYCGSGLTLKKCNNGTHNRNYRLFRKIDRALIEHDFENHIYKF